MTTKSARIASEAAGQFRRGKILDGIYRLIEFADRGVNNSHTELLFKSAIDEEFAEFKDGVLVPRWLVHAALEVAQSEYYDMLQVDPDETGQWTQQVRLTVQHLTRLAKTGEATFDWPEDRRPGSVYGCQDCGEHTLRDDRCPVCGSQELELVTNGP